jgi:hypothetical protein
MTAAREMRADARKMLYDASSGRSGERTHVSEEGKRGSLRQVLARLRRAARRPARDSEQDVPAAATSGLTVFGDAIRLRNLTPEPLEPFQEDPHDLGEVFKIRLAGSRASRRTAGDLIERRYASRGYRTPRLVAEENLRTLVAYRDNRVVGTISVRVDSPRGLSVDEVFPEELAQLRATGARLNEFTRLAVEGDKVSPSVLGALFHTAYLYAHRVRECDCAVIEVNPRHAVYYRRALSFDVIGPERFNARVQAPSVLLCTPLERLASGVDGYYALPERERPGRSAYAHWFPPGEATGVLNRLLELEARVAASSIRAPDPTRRR